MNLREQIEQVVLELCVVAVMANRTEQPAALKAALLRQLTTLARTVAQEQRTETLMSIALEFTYRGCAQSTCRNFLDPNGSEPHGFQCPMAWAKWMRTEAERRVPLVTDPEPTR